MPSILIIAYYFPPWGMGGVQRLLKFAKYLPEFGWDVTVIAPQPAEYHRQDPSLLTDLPASVRIERIPYRDAAQALGPIGPLGPFLRWLSSWRDFPDRHRRFARLATARARELMRERRFDIMLTSSPPPSLHMAGIALRSELPWIADFRDPWQALEDDYGPSLVHRIINSGLHKRVLGDASAVITVTPKLTRRFRSISQAARIETIRNGFDEADFDVVVDSTISRDTLKIVLPGTFSRFSDPCPVFAAIAASRKSNPVRKLRVIHVGASLGVDVTRMVHDAGLGDVYEDVGYVDHARAIREMCDADLLMLAYNDRRVTDLSVPGRVYEALRTLRPLVVFTPDNGALSSLLQPLGGCIVIPSMESADSADPIASALTLPPRSLDSLKQFTRRAQAMALSALCHEFVEQGREPSR